MSVRLEYDGVRVDVLAIEMLPMEIVRLNKFFKDTWILMCFQSCFKFVVRLETLYGISILNEPHICGYESVFTLWTACRDDFYPKGKCYFFLDARASL